MAFDTGPGNMVIDGCMRRLYEREFDQDGAVARSGNVLKDVVEKILKEGYFSALPPKSCGREQFGEAFVSRFIAMCRKAGGAEDRDEDVVATATALTAASIVDAYRRFVWGHVGQAAPLSPVEFVVAGGGAKNDVLMRMLRDGLEPMKVQVGLMEELGVPAQAKEAVAFALLAWLSWNGLPGNVPAATGAKTGGGVGEGDAWVRKCGRKRKTNAGVSPLRCASVEMTNFFCSAKNVDERAGARRIWVCCFVAMICLGALVAGDGRLSRDRW